MIRTIQVIFMFLSMFVLAPGVQAQGAAGAEALVKDVTNEVLRILREDKNIQSGDRQRAISVIETKVAPHFDFGRMTNLAVGAAWKRASADQQQQLIKEFRTLLVRTYANALVEYRNQTVSFRPARTGEAGEVRVPCQINQPGGRPIELVYSLAKASDDWKVFDVVIDNISLVTNYRSSFATEVENGGIDGLIKALQGKNRNLKGNAAPVAKEAK